jgi:hypothetical protein
MIKICSGFTAVNAAEPIVRDTCSTIHAQRSSNMPARLTACSGLDLQTIIALLSARYQAVYFVV